MYNRTNNNSSSNSLTTLATLMKDKTWWMRHPSLLTTMLTTHKLMAITIQVLLLRWKPHKKFQELKVFQVAQLQKFTWERRLRRLRESSLMTLTRWQWLRKMRPNTCMKIKKTQGSRNSQSPIPSKSLVTLNTLLQEKTLKDSLKRSEDSKNFTLWEMFWLRDGPESTFHQSLRRKLLETKTQSSLKKEEVSLKDSWRK